MKTITSGNQAAALFCLAALVANHAIFRLGAMPFAFALAIILALGVIAVLAPDLARPGSPAAPLNRWNVAFGLVALAPVIASLVLGWNRDFPFSGDQSFHVKQTYYMAYWWALPPGSPSPGILGRTLGLDAFRGLLARPWNLLWSRAAVLAIMLVIAWRCYRVDSLYALVFAAAALITWGLFERTIYLRYPGSVYVFNMPFVVPGFLLGNVELAGRVTNVAAPVAWLFALRPWLLRRWPDISILPAAAFLLWQEDVLYYLDSTYLEPWAFIFTLLAVESLILRGREGAPIACLMVGCAATVKEPFILALPLVWLAGCLPWTSLRDAVRLSTVAFAAAFPFVIYYFARKSVDPSDIISDRTYDFRFSSDAASIYAQEFLHRMTEAFPGPSAIAALAALGAVVFAFWRGTHERVPLACLFAAGVGAVLFFAFDVKSQLWPGYFRFFLPALPFLAVGAFLAGPFLEPRNVLIVAGATLLLQAQSAYVAVARSAGPATERNFVEHYDAPLVFPLKTLLAQGRRKGILGQHEKVIANQPDDTVRTVPGIDVEFGPLGKLYCRCDDKQPDVMALFVRYTNLGTSIADRPLQAAEGLGLAADRQKIWRDNRASRPACLAELRRTCNNVLEQVEGGEVVGALGTH